MIYGAYDLSYISKQEFEELKEESNEIVKHIANFTKYLKTRNK